MFVNQNLFKEKISENHYPSLNERLSNLTDDLREMRNTSNYARESLDKERTLKAESSFETSGRRPSKKKMTPTGLP